MTGREQTASARGGIWIGIGSNIHPEANLHKAAALLQDGLRGEPMGEPDLRLLRASPVYRTPPWGDIDQDDFLNAVLEVETELAPLELLTRLQSVEQALERERTRHWGPRTIDLDLLACDQTILRTTRLTLPHPLLHQRAFVLLPWCDLAPDWRHPATGHTVHEMLHEVDCSGIQRVSLGLSVISTSAG